MSGFELQTSEVGSNRSTYGTTTTAPRYATLLFRFYRECKRIPTSVMIFYIPLYRQSIYATILVSTAITGPEPINIFSIKFTLC